MTLIGAKARISLIAVAAVGVIGFALWVTHLRSENIRLQTDLETTLNANSSLEDAMHAMAKEQVALNQQIIERDKSQRQIQRDLANTQRRLRDAHRAPEITDRERECANSDLPPPILDIMRETPHRNGYHPSGEGMPTCCPVLGAARPAVRGANLGGPGGVHQGPAGAHQHAQRGSRFDPGVL